MHDAQLIELRAAGCHAIYEERGIGHIAGAPCLGKVIERDSGRRCAACRIERPGTEGGATLTPSPRTPHPNQRPRPLERHLKAAYSKGKIWLPLARLQGRYRGACDLIGVRCGSSFGGASRRPGSRRAWSSRRRIVGTVHQPLPQGYQQLKLVLRA